MLAVINLFIFVLKYPTLQSVQSDLALLDMAAGHFGHIHLLTSSSVSFSFPREVAALAAQAGRKATSKTTDDSRILQSEIYESGVLSTNFPDENVILYTPLYCLVPTFYTLSGINFLS